MLNRATAKHLIVEAFTTAISYFRHPPECNFQQHAFVIQPPNSHVGC
jgi:hypothetical protein